jgi:tetratricopeptide (TPR) repeat protein
MRRQILIGAVVLLAVVLPLLAAIAYQWQANSIGTTMASPLLTAAIADLERAIALEPQNVEGYRLLSRAYRMANDFDAAAAVWAQAHRANPNQSWPLVELGKLYEQQGLMLKARDAYYQASALNPQDTNANQQLVRSTGVVAAQQAITEYLANQTIIGQAPSESDDFVLLNQKLDNGWTFLGYIANEEALLTGDVTDIWSFWQGPTPNSQPTNSPEQWQSVSPGIWSNYTNVKNLLDGGTFEEALSGNSPTGFPSDLYSASPGTRQLRRIQQGERTTTVGALINDAENRNTSYASTWKSIDSDSAYIISADVYNDGGNPYVGWRWSGLLPTAYQSVEQYAAPVEISDAWQQYVGLADPVPGASRVQVWLLNTNTEGTAYFDNIFVAPVPVPAPLYPGITDRNQEQLATWESLHEQLLRFPPSLMDPQWQAKVAANGPLVPIGQTLDSGWTLLGYSTDETSLVSAEPTLLVAYWQGPIGAMAGSTSEGWIDLHDGNWLHVISDATNLTPNGTFENGLSGWETDLFSAPPWTRQLTVTQRSGFTTTIGVLTNTLEFSSTSFLSSVLPVVPRTVYLQSGWLNGSSGRGYIGRVWEGDFPSETELQDSYIAAAEQPGSWRRYAGVAEPPPGATGVQVWLLNYLSEGVSSFDDILFVPIPAPAPIDMGSGLTLTPIDPVRARDLLAQYQDDPSMLEDEAWLAGVADIGPALVLNQDAGSGWTLAGFTADEQALAAGAVTTAFYFWRGPEGVTPGQASEGWYSLDAGYWLQIDDSTTSLLPNGNFERSAEDAEEGMSFPRDYATGEPASDRLQTVERTGAPTTAAVLANSGPNTTTGIASDELPVDAGRLYIQTGWLRSSEGGNGVLGVSWTGEQLSTETPPTELIASDVSNAEWAQYAGLLMPPPGATGVRVLAYNYLAPGSVEVDDILLLPVLPPLELAPAVGAAPSLERGRQGS